MHIDIREKIIAIGIVWGPKIWHKRFTTFPNHILIVNTRGQHTQEKSMQIMRNISSRISILLQTYSGTENSKKMILKDWTQKKRGKHVIFISFNLTKLLSLRKGCNHWTRLLKLYYLLHFPLHWPHMCTFFNCISTNSDLSERSSYSLNMPKEDSICSQKRLICSKLPMC